MKQITINRSEIVIHGLRVNFGMKDPTIGFGISPSVRPNPPKG